MEKVLLIILDGWGASAETKGNACIEAETSFMDKLLTSLPATTLQAAAQAVGLPFGEMGNKPGLFWLPAGMDIDNNNNIYVADQYNRRINVYKFLGSGDSTTPQQ